jgi:hypothetical protein
MACDLTSTAHPRILLWGQLRRCKAHCRWHQRALKLAKFGCGANVGGFVTSATTSSNVIKVFIFHLSWIGFAHTRGQSIYFFRLLRTVDCSLG